MSAIANANELLPATGLPDQYRGGGPPGAPTETGGLGAADVWRVIKQRKLMIAIVFAVVFLLSVGATLAVARFAPQYTAETYLELLPPAMPGVQIEPTLIAPEVMKLQLESEARKLKAPSNLSEVLGKLEVKNTNFYRWYGDDFAQCLTDFESLISATAIPDTSIVRLRFSCKWRNEAKFIVDTLADFYTKKHSTDAQSDYGQKKTNINTSLDSLKRERDDLQKRMAQFRARVDVPQMESQRTVIGEHLSKLMSEIALYEANAAQLQAQAEAVRQLGPNLPITPEAKIIVESDPILRQWRVAAENLRVELDAARHKLGPKHDTMLQMQTRYQGLLELEAGKREELINDLRRREVESLQQSLASAQAVLLSLHEDREEAQTRQRDLDRNYQEFLAMQDDDKRLQERIRQLETALTEAEFAVTDLSRRRLRWAAPAELPHQPSRPNYPVYLSGGFLLALLASFGLAFLRELTDNAVRTPVDVARHGRISVLGWVPEVDEDETTIDQIEMAMRTAPQSLVAESFRQVRTNLLFSGPAETQRSLLVTSPSPGDGKTTVALNLAVALARGNNRVLLVDCNFRRPSIRPLFPEINEEGLSNVLVGQRTIDQVLSKSDIPNLDLLSTGPMPPTPAELLGTRYMRELIAEAMKRYDRVILDSPPVLLVSDALILATLVDGVILVARAVSNSRGALKRARELLAKVGARAIGAVLNGVRSQAGGYYRRQYREFYDYGSTPEIGRELPPADEKRDT